MTGHEAPAPAPAQPEAAGLSPADYQPQWHSWTRQLMIVLLIIAGVYTLTLLSPVIQMLTFAFIIAFLMYIPARTITRRTPIPYALSVVILYVLLIGVAIFALVIFIPAVVNATNNLIHSVENAYADLQDRLEEYTPQDGIVNILGLEADMNFIIEPLRDFIVETPKSQTITGAPPTNREIEPQTDSLTEFLQSIDLRQVLNSVLNVAGTVTGTLASAITTVTGLIATLLLALFLSFLIVVDWPRSEGNISRWVPQPYQREFRLLVLRVVAVWRGFFVGQLIIGFVIGLLTWLQLRLLGINGAEVLAIFTGFISLIPTIGGIIALIPLGLVPLFQGSTVITGISNFSVMLIVIGINFLITQMIWNVVAPAIIGDALDLPLPMIIVGVFIGAAVAGIAGAFLVAPIMGTLRVLVLYVFKKLGRQDPFPGEQVPIFETLY